MISLQLSEILIPLQARLKGGDCRFTGCSTDTRTLKPGNLFIALRGVRYDGHDYVDAAIAAGAVAVLVDDELGTDVAQIIVEDTRKAIGMLAVCWRDRHVLPVVAITGSNGKTTVKEMVKSILSQRAPVLATQGNLNNDIGVPQTLFGLDAHHGYAVIEMGANHPGEIGWLSSLVRPRVAVITQCAPAHLLGFGSVEGVARAKGEIYQGLDASGTAVINADDDYAGYWTDITAGVNRLYFGIEHPAPISASEVRINPAAGAATFILHMGLDLIPVRLSVTGMHNVRNALAAAACVSVLGFSAREIAAGLEKMHGVSGRMERVHIEPDITVFNDTYNANPASLRAAMEVLSACPAPRWLALGDMGELGEGAVAFHRDAGVLARQYGIERLYATGELSRQACETFGEGAVHRETVQALAEAIRRDMPSGLTLLVKGSRSMRMETVVNSLGTNH